MNKSVAIADYIYIIYIICSYSIRQTMEFMHHICAILLGG
jgi:hypothetical protein